MKAKAKGQRGRKRTSVVAYIRVSGQGQVSGSGFDRQEKAVKQFCKSKNWNIRRIYRETHTGTEESRPVFNAMIEDLLLNGCKTIVIESLDRLARDLSVQMQLLSYLLSKDLVLYNAMTGQDVTKAMRTEPIMKAMVQMQGLFAELEKSLLVRKLRKARESQRETEGRCEGRKPFGYYPGEEETLRYIKRLYRKPRNGKRLGYYRIARRLNSEGFKTRTGKLWHGVTVKQIIERETRRR